MPKWKKGESGNPGGRPRVLGEVRELARQHVPAAIKELARLALKAKSETARVAAIRELLDRCYGKATVPIEEIGREDHGLPNNEPIEVLLVGAHNGRPNGKTHRLELK